MYFSVFWLVLFVVWETKAFQESKAVTDVMEKQDGHVLEQTSSMSKGNDLTTSASPMISKHEEIIYQKFDTAEYKPSMEILAVGFLYDNETTTLRVSVYVGIPEINGETYSAPTFRKQSLSATSPPSNPIVEKFTNFEFYLTALPNGISSEPPSNCLNDNFLQHSSRNVMVGCPLTRGPSRYEKHNVDDNQTSCVGRDVRNFTVTFNHVYSAYYCLLIQPQVNRHTRRTFTRMLHYETNKRQASADITKWQTTIDLQPMPSSQGISVAFTLPNSTYQIMSDQLRVYLMQVSGERCNDSKLVQSVWSEILKMEPEKQFAEIAFFGKPPGIYCVVVEPIDERCNGNNVWKVKGGTCRRHSAKAVKLQASPLHMESNGNNKPLVIVRTPTTDVWASFYIICAFAVGLVLISLLGIMLVYRHRHKKRLQQRRQQYLAGWEPSTDVSPAQCSISDVASRKKLLNEQRNDISKDCDHILSNGIAKKMLCAHFSVLLLYRRDDAQVSQRATDLRKRLQSECGDKVKVYDYGDETQWEEMSIEGLDWLPNRIYGNQETNGCFNRVIVIHSPLQPQIREEKRLENDGDMECLNPLIIEQVPEAMARRRYHRHRNGHFSSTIDHEFLYGMQLLKGCIRESGDSCVNVEKQQHSQQHSQQSASLYRRIFNVRYTDMIDNQLSETENQNITYPDLTVAPFTCYLLPGHFNQLLQHLTST